MTSTGSALEEKQSISTILSTVGTVEDLETGGSTSEAEDEGEKTLDNGAASSTQALLSTLGVVGDLDNGGNTSVVEAEGEKSLGTGAASSEKKQNEYTAMVEDEGEKGHDHGPASSLNKMEEKQCREMADILSSDKAKLETELDANNARATPAPPSRLRRSAPVIQASGPGAYSMEEGRAQRLQPSSSVRSLGIASDRSLSEDESVSMVEDVNSISPEEVVLDGSLVPDTSEEEQALAGWASVSREPSSSHFSVGSMELIDGEIVDDTNTQKPQHQQPSSRNVLLLSAVLIIVGVAVVLAIYFGLSQVRKSEGASRSNDEATAPRLYARFENDTIPVVIANAIQDVDSPQYHANIWMLQDPYRDSYSMDRQWQRFYMASFYYMSNGDSWLRNDGWLSYDINECEWFNQDSSGNLGMKAFNPSPRFAIKTTNS